MTEDRSIEKIKGIETSARKIMERGLRALPYYNDSNYSKNSKTLKRIVLSGDNNLMDYGQFAMYWPSNNTLTVDEHILNNDEVPDEFLTMMMIHELLHMASTDIDKKVSGFQHEAMPASYTEALVQWLTLRLYFGREHIDEIVEKNEIYPESVKLLNNMIHEIGEESAYRGFFEADVKSHTKGLNDKQKSRWMDYFAKFHLSEEEKSIQKSIKSIYDNNKDNKDEAGDIEQ